MDFSKLSAHELPGLLDYFTIKVKRNVRIVSSSAEIALLEDTQKSTADYKIIIVRRQANTKSAFIHWTAVDLGNNPIVCPDCIL